MKINQENFVKELRKGNEKALLYVIDEYGGLLRSVIRRHLFALPDRQEAVSYTHLDVYKRQV